MAIGAAGHGTRSGQCQRHNVVSATAPHRCDVVRRHRQRHDGQPTIADGHDGISRRIPDGAVRGGTWLAPAEPAAPTAGHPL